MIHKTIIAARTLAKRSGDDRAHVSSPSGAADVSPGRESGDRGDLRNPQPRRGGTSYFCRPSGALLIKGPAIPGLASQRPGLLSVVPPGLGSAGVMTLLRIQMQYEYNVAGNASGICPECGITIESP